jgi:hypothetical protein
MRKERQLVPHAVLSGKVIAYKCIACDKTFSIPWLDGAVSTESPPPASIDDAFLRHTCEEHERSVLYTARYRYLEFLMALDEEDFPYSYLLYVIAVIMAIGLLVVGAFFFVFR